ncbi:hypothetical protein TELCIR_17287 [Teladorsagia circumcincta]|uniref:Uncharacterized protein n=1 Tax=Teladorsagia circumcincta TaxID=45464 RepID=A0A2G9TTH4_TELCI|nr:hypothetical protein TELCIR_17287 [Teladorsagia circumcincta]
MGIEASTTIAYASELISHTRVSSCVFA